MISIRLVLNYVGSGIGEISESSLHNQLKHHYHQPGAKLEETVDGYIVDIVNDQELIEIQTSSFSSVKRKYRQLLRKYNLKMVYPIAVKKWIVKYSPDGSVMRRKSPKQANKYEVFRELVRIPHLINQPNFTLELVFIHEEETRVKDGKGSWRRRGWSIVDHKLLKIIDTLMLGNRTDFMTFIPDDLPKQFTTSDISQYCGIPKYMAQKMAYTLKKMRFFTQIGKKGRYHLYQIDQSSR